MSEKKHGGKREGAGRKPSAIKTVVKRVPIQLVSAIDELIARMDTVAANGVHITKSQQLPLDGMMPANDTTPVLLPLGIEKIPAGQPALAEGYYEERIDLNEYLIRHPDDTIIVRCGGYSMLDAGIDKEDLLIIDRAIEPKHHDIVMADLGNEYTIKRLYKKDGKVELHSENDSEPHPNFIFKEGDQLSIVGVVLHVLKSVR